MKYEFSEPIYVAPYPVYDTASIVRDLSPYVLTDVRCIVELTKATRKPQQIIIIDDQTKTLLSKPRYGTSRQ
jgi:hypothetical protein